MCVSAILLIETRNRYIAIIVLVVGLGTILFVGYLVYKKYFYQSVRKVLPKQDDTYIDLQI